MAKKYCIDCGVTHTSIMCFNKPRLAIKVKRDLNWEQTRIKWMLLNPTTDGYYYYYLNISNSCIIRCKPSSLILDHVTPRSRGVKYKYSLDNLRPACYWCNSLKGSRTIENLAKDYPQLNYLTI